MNEIYETDALRRIAEIRDSRLWAFTVYVAAAVTLVTGYTLAVRWIVFS